MFLSKFIYDLTSHPKPTDEELDEDIDRLLFLKGVECPDKLYLGDERDSINMDSEVFKTWIQRRFEPALILLILDHDSNYHMAVSELTKMSTFRTIVEKFCRCDFVKRRAIQRLTELCFDNPKHLKMPDVVSRLKKTLTLLSNHLEDKGQNRTLFGTETYTPADIMLYNYLKRIVVGKYKDFGLRNHVKLCDPIKQFMHLYATRNTGIIDVSNEDPLAEPDKETSLLVDMTKPAIIALLFIGFFVWNRDRVYLVS